MPQGKQCHPQGILGGKVVYPIGGIISIPPLPVWHSIGLNTGSVEN